MMEMGRMLSEREELVLALQEAGLPGAAHATKVEGYATDLTIVSPDAIPELFMSGSYLREFYGATQPGVDVDRARQQAELTRERQQLTLERVRQGGIKTIRLVVGELALLSAARYVDGLVGLLDAVNQDLVELYVLPVEAPLHPMVNQPPFTSYRSLGPDGVREEVLIGSPQGGRAIFDRDKVRGYRAIIDKLIGQTALSPEDSGLLLQRIAERTAPRY